MSQSLKKKFFFAVKLLISGALITWLVLRVDWHEIGVKLSNASLGFVFLAFLLYVLGMLISVNRWQATAHFKGFSLKFRDGIRYHFAGLFLNNFLPSFFGGDAYRSYLLGKPSKRYAAAVSTVFFVRFAGLWAAIALFIVFGFLASGGLLLKPHFFLFALVLPILLVVDVILTIYSDHSWIQKLFSFAPEKLQNFFAEISGYTDKKFVWDSFLVSCLFTLVGVGLFNLTLFWAFHETVDPLTFLSVVFLVSIIASLPVSINNIGLKEWAYFTFFPAIAIDPETALTVALVGRFLQMFASLFGAPFFFREKQEAEAHHAEKQELHDLEVVEEKIELD